MKKLCFTLDDNIRFLQEITQGQYENILKHPYLALLHKMHKKYGAKFQLNMFYSYTDGGFSLSDVPKTYFSQFENCSNFLKMSFHSAYNEPAFPYENATAHELLTDYDKVYSELLRIVPKSIIANTTTLHYVAATKDAITALGKRGVKGLIAMAHKQEGRLALQYHLNNEQAEILRKNDFYYEKDTDITYLLNHLIVDRVSIDDLPIILNTLCNKSVVQIMTHEQYFYKDYKDYQKDYARKMELCFKTLQKYNYESCFFEDLL